MTWWPFGPKLSDLDERLDAATPWRETWNVSAKGTVTVSAQDGMVVALREDGSRLFSAPPSEAASFGRNLILMAQRVLEAEQQAVAKVADSQ